MVPEMEDIYEIFWVPWVELQFSTSQPIEHNTEVVKTLIFSPFLAEFFYMSSYSLHKTNYYWSHSSLDLYRYKWGIRKFFRDCEIGLTFKASRPVVTILVSFSNIRAWRSSVWLVEENILHKRSRNNPFFTTKHWRNISAAKKRQLKRIERTAPNR